MNPQPTTLDAGRWPAVVVIFMVLMLPDAACRNPTTQIELTLQMSPAMARPTRVQLTWINPRGPVERTFVPEAAMTAGSGGTVATVSVQIDSAAPGARKLIAVGYQGDVAWCEGVARLTWKPGETTRQVIIMAGLMPDTDGDGLPDAIDDDCSGPQTCGGQTQAGDGSAAPAIAARPPDLGLTVPPDVREEIGDRSPPVDTSPARVPDAAAPDPIRPDVGVDSAPAVDPGACPMAAPDAEGLVSDFDHGSAAVLTRMGRGPQGWYEFDDGTPGTHAMHVEPHPLAACAGRGALHVTSSGFTTWGSGVGFGILSAGSNLAAYDASHYRGIRLRMRAAVEPTAITLQLLTAATSTGGGCRVCSDHPRATASLSTQWNTYTFIWSDFKQQGFGDPPTPATDAAHLLTVQFFLWKPGPYDVWLDDVEFVP